MENICLSVSRFLGCSTVVVSLPLHPSCIWKGIVVVSLVGIEKNQLLTAIIQIIRVIDIKDYSLCRFAIGLDKHIYKHFCNPEKICSVETVFKQVDGRLAGHGQIIIGRPLTGYFHYRIAWQFIDVIEILIETGDLKNPLLKKLKELMFDITAPPPGPEGISHFTDQTYAVSNLRRKRTPAAELISPPLKSASIFLLEMPLKRSNYYV
jgi:hypothetical protein